MATKNCKCDTCLSGWENSSQVNICIYMCVCVYIYIARSLSEEDNATINMCNCIFTIKIRSRRKHTSLFRMACIVNIPMLDEATQKN